MEELYGLKPKAKPVKPTPTTANDDDDASSDKNKTEKKAFVPVSRAESKRRKRGLEPSTPAPKPAVVSDEQGAKPAAKKAKKNKPVKPARAVKPKEKEVKT